MAVRAPWYTPGWTYILDALCEAVERHEHDAGTTGQWQARADEKFGRLRLSSTGDDAHTEALKELAVLLSQRTCQECGASGAAVQIGPLEPKWHATLCKDCELRCRNEGDHARKGRH